MQTALHIYSLVRELQSSIIGAVFKGTEFYKKQREAHLLFKTRKGLLSLGLVYHPHSYGTFLIPRGKLKMETEEKPWPFFQPAHGGEVVSVMQIGFDRLFLIELAKGTDRFTIVTEAIGPNGNFWLLDSTEKILATLRNRKYDPSKKYTPPALLDKLNPFKVELRHLIEIFSRCDQSVENVLRRGIVGLDKFLIREIVARTGVDSGRHACETDEREIEKICSVLKEMVHHFDDYTRGYFYEHPLGNLAYPFKLRTLEDKLTKCKSLSLAVYSAIRTKRAIKEELAERQTILDAVKRFAKRLSRKISKIEKDLELAQNFEQYKKFAEILKIHIPSIKKGAEYVELVDVYSGSGKIVIIELDPELTPAQNADLYFKKYRKGKDGLELLKRRLEITKAELSTTQSMLEEFETDFDSAVSKYEAELNGILPKAAEKRAPAVRLPYKEHQLSTGLTIFVGRDGADNDNTTFGYGKPYELWFHTSQCPGSHVVMKFPDRSFVPSKSEIIETAAVAAYYSKAKNSRTVAVIYTQKKYVRKPRGAKPGLVTVEREKLVMVEPKKPG